MKKILFGILIVLGIAAIAIGTTMIYGQNKDKQEELESLKASIVSNYDVFKTKIETFSQARSNVSQKLNDISYLTDLKNEYDIIVDEFKKYEDTLKEVDQASINLKEEGLNRNFKDTNINNKMDAFVINYEQAINYFIKDVNVLNAKIEEYNEWIDTQIVMEDDTKLLEYETTYKEYMDVDGDGVFNGVEK